jgi:SPX domain protein involved in polyphosphate accumulation
LCAPCLTPCPLRCSQSCDSRYVNLNLLGLHKILKKHDKNIPSRPLYQFYVSWLHKHKWLAGDYSQELVMLSELFSKLRGDRSGVKNEDAAQARIPSVCVGALLRSAPGIMPASCMQGFVRSTKKYWVKEEAVSQVKYTVLQHLPVFRFDETKFTGDCQLINSVYLDNCSCELYHGRLDKRPGAQAIRLRWYGSGRPETVFVERKVHQEGWTGESSSKERFRLPEEKVLPYLRGEYMWDQVRQLSRAEGRWCG